MSLGIGLLWGPTGGVFLMSKVPLYPLSGDGVDFHLNSAATYRGTSRMRTFPLLRTPIRACCRFLAREGLFLMSEVPL